jgi:hypothetical protein
MEPERRLEGRNGSGRLRPPLKSDPPVHNLLRAKNGLDNRDTFKFSKKACGQMNLSRFYAIAQIEYFRNFIFKRHFPIHK